MKKKRSHSKSAVSRRMDSEPKSVPLSILIRPGRVIAERRRRMGLKAIELSRLSGVDPRTLDAIEKERVKMPSLTTLEPLVRVLGISVASLFSDGRPQVKRMFHQGGQKGLHTLEFPKDGFRVICYTPLVPDMFVGKVIIEGEKRIASHALPVSGSVFVQVLIGRLLVAIGDSEYSIREGNYAFFDGNVPHHYLNPQSKDNSFLLVTIPSFLSRENPPLNAFFKSADNKKA